MRVRTTPLAAVAVGGLLSAGLVIATPSQAAPGDDAACPAAFPAASLVVGQTQATGLTTAGSYNRGGTEHNSATTPEEFDGVYRGTVEDPFGDLFIFELSGSRITDENGDVDAGIWAGISGSPLYAADGSLIGSVSYTFGGYENTRYAGVTPASDLYDLLGSSTAKAPQKITLDAKERQALKRQGVSAAAADAGLRKLAPVSTIGGMRGVPARLQKRIAKQAGVTLPTAAAGTGGQSEAIDIVPGGSVAFAASYGTMPFYSVGTAVAVCDDTVIGYGHAGNFAPASNTMHGASTQLIQPNAGQSFKLANLGAPVGSQTHDGINGVLGKIGALPASTEVVVNTRGTRTTSTTNHVSDPEALAYVTANHMVRDAVLSVDQAAGGSADVKWNIAYTRANGAKGTLKGSQKYSSRYYLSDYVYSDLAGILESLTSNKFEKVTVDKVTVDMAVSTKENGAGLSKLEIRKGSKWTAVKDGGKVVLKPGSKVSARFTAAPDSYKSTAKKVSKVFTFKADKKMRNAFISGEGASMGDDYYFEDYEEASSPQSMEQLLRQLAKVTPSDQVTVTYNKGRGGSKPRVQRTKWLTGAPTSGWLGAQVVFKK